MTTTQYPIKHVPHIELQTETQAAIAKLNPDCMDYAATRRGVNCGEPLLIAMDGLLRYAKAYEKRFERKLAEDYVLGPEWLASAKGIRGLLNGDGAVAMERGITTDSKSNGVIEETFWAALAVAGFEEKDL